MTGAFGQTISKSYQAVMRAYELYRADQSDEHAFDLRDIALSHLKTSPRKGEICAPLGMLHALARLGYARRWLIGSFVALTRFHPQMWNAPGWNDFEMGAWMVSREVFYTARIFKRLHHTKGMVQSTCAWMVNSVRQQEPEFDKQWREVENGQHLGRGYSSAPPNAEGSV